MGLFKDFREDFSQAVNELVPGGEAPEAAAENTDSLVVDTLNEEVDVQSELSKLDGLLEQVTEPARPKAVPAPEPKAEPKRQEAQKENVNELFTGQAEESASTTKKENRQMSETMNSTFRPIAPGEATEETSIITASTTLTGDIHSSGSFDIQGTINGNVSCNGKLVVTGTINGNSNSAEFFADVAKIEGEVVSSGTVKVGAGSVIIGNISAASAVVAGAVKGDIDVQGPVVIDTSAVIMGNIKSRSVQINNGAVIEGFCSQSYADIDVQGLFENK